MFRIMWDKEKTEFIPQRKGWFLWRHYSGHPYGSKRFGTTIIEALEIIDEDIKKRAEGGSTTSTIKWGFLAVTAIGLILLLLRSQGMI